MFGATLGLTALLALVAAAFLGGAAAFTRGAIHAAATHAADGGARAAVATYQVQLAHALELDPNLAAVAPYARAAPAAVGALSGNAALPGPASVTQTPAPDGDALHFTVNATATPTTIRAPRCGGGGVAGQDRIAWLQCDGHVQESRLSLHVVVTVRDPAGGEVLAQRDRYVTLRLFAERPYSAVVGALDGAADDPLAQNAAVAPHEGDLGGDTVTGALAPAVPSPYPAGGTLLHVRYACTAGAAPNEDCANAAPPDPDAHLAPGATWTNGNAPQP